MQESRMFTTMLYNDIEASVVSLLRLKNCMAVLLNVDYCILFSFVGFLDVNKRNNCDTHRHLFPMKFERFQL